MAVRQGIRHVDRRFGSPLKKAVDRARTVSLVETAQGKAGMLRFEIDRQRRRRRYPDVPRPSAATQAVVDDLNRDGVARLPGVLAPGAVAAVKAELEACLDAGRPLNPASNDAAREPGDLREAAVHLAEADLAAGQAHCRRLTNHLSVDHPLVNCPSTLPLAFEALMIEIAAGYLGCMPAIGGLNLRKSYVNELADFDTLYFHSDPNSPRFLKFFIYLNDVDENGGPFCYAKGTQTEKFRGWRAKYRWTPEEIEHTFGVDRMAYMTGEVGDLIVADTTGFHRGTKVRDADRSMLTVDYVVHPEFSDRVPRSHIASDAYERLSERERAVADLLVVDRR